MKFRVLVPGVIFVLCIAAQTSAQITGFSAAVASKELAVEHRLISEIKPDTLRSIVTAISREVHVAGTPAQARTRDYVIDRWKRAGLSTKVYPYEVYIPHAKSSSLVINGGEPYHLGEYLLPDEDSSSEYPWVNGYSASGTAEGNVIYVNYGLHEDYHELDSLGVSLKGKIAIARYGKSYRGIKAMLAEQHGAAGLLIYSDPSQDGYDAGDILPDGPMRNWNTVQRGSIWNGHGDPTTPGYASIAGAKRMPIESISMLPRIPVIPISYSIANMILGGLHGRDIPNSGWQGGLAFRYHIGGDGVKAKLTVNSDTGLKPIWNTVATIEGSTWPDEWIIVGGHRDAWCHGAEDNASGCASVVAAAEAFAKLAKEGIRPKRSILFVTWDAEEWGLLGSTEWVEQLEPELKKKAVAYINQDMCATGSTFGASADPSLRELVYEVSNSLHDPHDSTIYSAWMKSSKAEQKPEIGLLGGGSDFSPFYNHLGIPSLEHGFSGPFGQYHSNHDNIQWTLRFGDSTFAYHALSSQFLSVEAMRLANADILPFDFAELGAWLASVATSTRLHSISKFHDSLGFADLDSAIVDFRSAANDYALLREPKALHNSALLADAKKLSALNREIRNVGLAFTEVRGLPTDSWERNMLVISDPQNGYADLTLPAIGIAIRGSEVRAVINEVEHLARHVRDATIILRQIVGELRAM